MAKKILQLEDVIGPSGKLPDNQTGTSSLGGNIVSNLEPIRVKQVSSRTYGIVALRPNTKARYHDQFVHHNDALPVTVEKPFCTSYPNQDEVPD